MHYLRSYSFNQATTRRKYVYSRQRPRNIFLAWPSQVTHWNKEAGQVHCWTLRQCELYVKTKSRLVPYDVTSQWLLNLTTYMKSKKISSFSKNLTCSTLTRENNYCCVQRY